MFVGNVLVIDAALALVGFDNVADVLQQRELVGRPRAGKELDFGILRAVHALHNNVVNVLLRNDA